MSSKLLVIVGPTASGKTALALELARKFDGEIICADSRTVYRYMNVGTAKPSATEMMQIPHHLVNVLDPDVRFTAAQFKELAVLAVQDIINRGKLPIMVGGTGMYIDSVLFDYQFPTGANLGAGVATGRARMISQDELSLDELVGRLENLDPLAAEKIDLKNRRRVERAIETVGFEKSKSRIMRPQTLVLGMALDKNIIRYRAEQRVEKMLEEGLIEEVRQIGREYGWDCEALKIPSYLAFKDVVLGQKSVRDGAAEVAKRDLNLAKRQMTWFKRNNEIVWLDATDSEKLLDEAVRFVRAFL